jgi:hypothetical protein
MAFDFPDIAPGLNGNLNIRRLETKEFGVLKRLYDQAQTYGKDSNLNQPAFTTKQIPPLESGGPTGQIGRFLSIIRSSSIARPSYYSVQIRPKGKIARNAALEDLSVMCEAAAFPGQTILTTPVRTYGPPVEMPYMRVNDTLTLSFIVDKSMNTKLIFDRWLNTVVSGGVGETSGNNNVGFYSDYTGEVEVFSLSKSTEMPTYSVKLINAYPKAIESIPLGYNMGDEYMKLVVQFVYERMELSIVVEDISAIPSPEEEMRVAAGIDTKSNPKRTVGTGLTGTANTIIDRFRSQTSNVTRRGTEVTGSVTNIFSEIGTRLNNATTDTTTNPDP